MRLIRTSNPMFDFRTAALCVLVGAASCGFTTSEPVLGQDQPKVPGLLQLLIPRAARPAIAKKALEEKPVAAKAADKKAEAKKAAAKEEAVEADFAIVDAVNVDPFQQQFSRQFKGLLKAELFFLNQTCGVTPEQRAKLKTQGEVVLKEVVTKFVELQKKMNQGGFDWNSPAPEPRKHIQDSLLNEAKSILSPEQVARYENELARRQEARKRTSVANVVARIDDELILTPEQRVQLTEALTANWKTAETQQMEIFLYGEHYFPNIPEQLVTPALNQKQKDIWKGMSRTGNIFFGIGHTGNVAIDENAWNDEADSAPKSGTSKTGKPEAAKPQPYE